MTTIDKLNYQRDNFNLPIFYSYGSHEIEYNGERKRVWSIVRSFDWPASLHHPNQYAVYGEGWCLNIPEAEGHKVPIIKVA